MDEFKSDYKEAIQRASDAGVTIIVNVGANLKNSRLAVEMARKEKNLYATVGMHPHDAVEEEFNVEDFNQLAQDEKVVAIGETGLDFSAGSHDREVQIALMDKQIKVAIKLNKPVVFHCRDAYNDLISYLMSLPQMPKGVIHCFVGDWSHAQIFLDMGFLLSFTGIVTFTKNNSQLNVIENTPLEKILIETDAPWLAPESHRGKRNEPSFVIEVARKIAELKKIPLSLVEKQTTKNAKEFFKLHDQE